MIKQRFLQIRRQALVRAYILSRKHREYLKWADAPNDLKYLKPETVSRVGAAFDALYESPLSKWVSGK